MIGLAVSLILGPVIIPMLRRLKAGQSIREEGPKSHYKKSGTPTIGGMIFVLAVLITLAVTGNIKGNGILIASTLGFGLIGFVDDYIKVVMKRSLGLTEMQKIVAQFVLALAIAFWAKSQLGTSMIIPFINYDMDFGSVFIPFLVVVIIATVNSANLTDGLDGLATSVTTVIFLAFAYIAHRLGADNVVIFAMAFVGACLGFLRVNFNPAKVFMGDAGSMALGGAVVAIAIVLRMELLIPIIALIYFIEALSVIIQVSYYKRTKKRVFLMSPIHHHYEHKGMTEKQIVFAFSMVTLALSVVGVLSVM